MKPFALLALALVLAACSDERPLEPRPPVRTSHSASPSGPPTANATVTWLGEDAAQPGGENPLHINAGGTIVGHGCCSPQHGLIFAPPPVRSVPVSSDPTVAVFVQIARGINEAGQFTGLGIGQFGVARAFVGGTDGPASLLPTLPRAAEQWGDVGHDISNAGHVVGSTGFSGTEAHATLWRNTSSGYVVEDLGLLDGNSTLALAIAAGSGANPLIVGTVGSRAFRWQSGVYTLLPQVAGSHNSWSYAEDVLDNGMAVGFDLKTGPGGAVLWRGGEAIDLHPVCEPLWPEGSGGPSVAHGIAVTPSGRILIVGKCFGPTVWYDDGQGGFEAELLPLLTGDATGEAFDVNESGQIVGVSGGHAVLWTFAIPSDEPDNQPPTADAGPDETVDGESRSGTNVMLDGSGSHDPDGTIAKYEWFEGDARIATGGTPMATLGLGMHTLRLVVTDDDGATHEDVVTITVLGPAEQITQVDADLEVIVAENPDTPLGDKAEDALAQVQAAQQKLAETPPDRQGALGELEGAVGDLETAVKDGLLDEAEGTALMRRLVAAARILAEQAIAEAQARGGDSPKMAEAERALGQGDAARDSAHYKLAVAAYKDAVAQAEGA